MLPRLRDYQRRWIEGSWACTSSGVSSHVVAATGTGKTWGMAGLLRVALLLRPDWRVLVSAPRRELLDQFERTLGLFVSDVVDPQQIGREQAERRAHRSHRVVLGSLDTLSTGRASELGLFDLWLIDEAHYSIDRLVELAGDGGLPGSPCRSSWTATPLRTDGRDLVGCGLSEGLAAAPFGLLQAISAGWLVPPVVRSLMLEIESSSSEPGFEGMLREPNQELTRRYLSSRPATAAYAKAVLREASDRPGLIYASSVDHAWGLAQCLRELGAPAACVHGDMPERERSRVLAGFESGDVDHLVSVDVLSMGVDVPRARYIAFVRTIADSTLLLLQMMGRGLRLYPGKDECLVLDFCLNAHRLRPFDYEGAEASVHGELDGARIGVAPSRDERATLEELLEPTDLERLTGWRELLETVGYRAVLDRSQTIEELADPNASSSIGRSLPATVEQARALRDAGLACGSAVSRGAAQSMLEALRLRQEIGLCSMRQARQLASRGLNPNAGAPAADAAMGALQTAGWPRRVPRKLLVDFPELLVTTTVPVFRVDLARPGHRV